MKKFTERTSTLLLVTYCLILVIFSVLIFFLIYAYIISEITKAEMLTSGILCLLALVIFFFMLKSSIKDEIEMKEIEKIISQKNNHTGPIVIDLSKQKKSDGPIVINVSEIDIDHVQKQMNKFKELGVIN